MSGNRGTAFAPTLILSVFITCLGSSLLYGYNLAVLNGPGDHIRCFFNQTIMKGLCANESANSTTKSNHELELLYSLTATLFVVFGAIGAFCTGIIADNLGRRNGLLFNHIFVIIGGVISAPTVYVRIPYLLYVGRAFIGFNCGVTIGLASIYLTEIAPQRVRGAIGACHQLAVTTGILVAMLTGLKQLMNTPMLWSIAQGLTCIPAVISLCVLPFCPESPRFLYMIKGREEQARQALRKLNHVDDTEEQLREMRQEREATRSQDRFRFSRLFTNKDLRMPLMIAVLIQVMQQLSGINAVISFSSTMLKSANVAQDMIPVFNVGIGVLNVVCTIVALPMLERFGRRTLLLVPSVVLAICLLCLTLSVNLVMHYPHMHSLVWASVGFTYLYVASFAFGLGTIPALIVAEIFRQQPRSAAYSVSQAVQWCVNLMVSTTYPNLQKAVGGYVFLVYLVVVVFCWIFFFMFMPETKNRSFDDIAHDLAFGTVLRRRRRADAMLQGDSSASPANSKTHLTANGKHMVDDSCRGLLNQNCNVELNDVPA